MSLSRRTSGRCEGAFFAIEESLIWLGRNTSGNKRPQHDMVTLFLFKLINFKKRDQIGNNLGLSFVYYHNFDYTLEIFDFKSWRTFMNTALLVIDIQND